MRHIHSITAWLIVFFASSLMASEPALTTRLPEGAKIWARGETLPQLAQKTHADLSFAEDSGQPLLLWSCHTYSGQPFFRLASAVNYQSHAGQKEWLILDNSYDWVTGEMLIPRHAITTRGRPARSGVGADLWWQTVSTHPTFGTIYEIEYYHQLAGEAAYGTRLIVLEDLNHRWHFVTTVLGDYWDDTGWTARTQVSVNWTNDPQNPLQLNLKRHEDTNDLNTGKSDSPHWITETHYAGKLPLLKPMSVRYLLKVRKGETFNQLLKLMISRNVSVSGGALWVKSEVMQALKNRILELNPGLDVEHLAVGQEIVVPSGSDQRALIDAAQNDDVSRRSGQVD